MDRGGWIPLCKRTIKFLAKNRPYTKAEAAICLQVDYDENNQVTVAGYAKVWKWSRNKVFKFLQDVGAEIVYPKDTKKKQNQKGQITIQIRDRCETDNEQIRFYNNKGLQSKKDTKGADQGHKKDREASTTIYTNTNNNKKIFRKPTVEEVKKYCLERENNIDPQYFIDSNEAKGWVVGKTKTPMKDWKAVIRTWESNQRKKKPIQINTPQQAYDATRNQLATMLNEDKNEESNDTESNSSTIVTLPRTQ